MSDRPGQLVVVGWYREYQQRSQRGLIRQRAKALDAKEVRVQTTSFLDAIADAVDHRERLWEVLLIGPLDNVLPPAPREGEPAIDPVTWRESILGYLESHQIAFEFIDVDGASLVWKRDAEVARAISRYSTAARRLEEEIKGRRQVPVVRGRPPYGYYVRDGLLRIDPVAAEAITTAFTERRNGRSAGEVLGTLKKEFPRKGPKKPQFWDYVKLRRIINRAPLYCLGRVDRDTTIPDLAFLPADWADTTYD